MLQQTSGCHVVTGDRGNTGKLPMSTRPSNPPPCVPSGSYLTLPGIDFRSEIESRSVLVRRLILEKVTVTLWRMWILPFCDRDFAGRDAQISGSMLQVFVTFSLSLSTKKRIPVRLFALTPYFPCSGVTIVSKQNCSYCYYLSLAPMLVLFMCCPIVSVYCSSVICHNPFQIGILSVFFIAAPTQVLP